MNTKSALIIAVAIVIGFSIEPILDRVDFSDPHHRLIKVVNTVDNEHMGYAFEFYVKAGDVKWEKSRSSGRWYSRNGVWCPADEYALKTILEMYGD
jgi:hypothetical protein